MNTSNQPKNNVLPWWTFRNENQPLYPFTDTLQVEHIFAKNSPLAPYMAKPQYIESLGNLALIEPNLNKAAKNFSFTDKRQIYTGYTNGRPHEGTFNVELKELAKKDDFTEDDIAERNNQMLEAILDELREHNLLWS